MADDTQLAQATQPFSFHDFLERMKEPQAADLVRKIKNFIKAFEERAGDPDRDGQAVQDFLADMEASFRHHPAWANATFDVQGQAVEALEKYLMTKLYHKTFGQSALDMERDEVLAQRMAALSFVIPAHLDIPEAYRNEESWLLARRELLKMSQYKAPRDKLVCMLNCCRVINNLLHLGAANSSDAKGADDFLPILIYVVIHANPPQLASNLEFVQRYRMVSRMVSEAAYFFTQLYSAASFIETINANSLSIDPDEFLARMLEAGVADVGLASDGPVTSPQKPLRQSPSPILLGAATSAVEQLPTSESAEVEAAIAASLGAMSTGNGVQEPTIAPAAAPSSMPRPALPPPPPPPPPMFPSAPELEAEGVGQITSLEAAGHMRERHRYLYAQAADLTLGDVSTLLEDYKRLVLHYEALAAAVQTRRNVSLQQHQRYSAAMSPGSGVPPQHTTFTYTPTRPLPGTSGGTASSISSAGVSPGAAAAAGGVAGGASERRGAAAAGAVLKMFKGTAGQVSRSFKGTALSLLEAGASLGTAGGGIGGRGLANAQQQQQRAFATPQVAPMPQPVYAPMAAGVGATAPASMSAPPAAALAVAMGAPVQPLQNVSTGLLSPVKLPADLSSAVQFARASSSLPAEQSPAGPQLPTDARPDSMTSAMPDGSSGAGAAEAESAAAVAGVLPVAEAIPEAVKAAAVVESAAGIDALGATADGETAMESAAGLATAGAVGADEETPQQQASEEGAMQLQGTTSSSLDAFYGTGLHAEDVGNAPAPVQAPVEAAVGLEASWRVVVGHGAGIRPLLSLDDLTGPPADSDTIGADKAAEGGQPAAGLFDFGADTDLAALDAADVQPADAGATSGEQAQQGGSLL